MLNQQSRKIIWVLSVIAFVALLAFLWQGALPGLQAQPRDKNVESGGPGGHGGGNDKDKDKGRVPCDPDPVTGGQGYCYKHRMGTWAGDAQNFPNCSAGANSWVCNSPGAACSDSMTANGHCQMTGSGATCNCQCKP
jgi:hypothetical protein